MTTHPLFTVHMLRPFQEFFNVLDLITAEYPSVPPSLLLHPLSFPPFLSQPPSLPTFLFKYLSPFLSLLSTLLSFFLFLSRGPAARHLKPARGVRESCKPGRQTVSVHSEVKTGFWWVVTAVLKRRTSITSHKRDQNSPFLMRSCLR